MLRRGCTITGTVTTTQLLVGSYRTIPLAWPVAPTRISTRPTHRAGSIRWVSQNDAAALAGSSRTATNHHRARRAIKVTTSFRTGGPKRTRSRAIVMAQHQRSSSPQNPIHKAISDSQNARRDAAVAAGRDPWSSSIQDQFNYSSQDMRAAGISDDCRKRALKKAYKHFDQLGAFK
jgi:hypothetical protein